MHQANSVVVKASEEHVEFPKRRFDDIHITSHEAQVISKAKKLSQSSCGRNKLDLLEVYAYPNSRLTETALQHGLKARRFSEEDGDLSTEGGQIRLLSIILRDEPENIWLAPECKPWGNWSRFNMNRSISSHEKIMTERSESKIHLWLCNLIAKLQLLSGRHVHLENPWGAESWSQAEISELMQYTMPVCVDQCQYGLRHPETHNPMQKKTRIQTSSKQVLQELDHRVCKRDHVHSQIAGQCQWRGSRVAVSRFAAFYPKLFARAIVRSIIKTVNPPDDHLICHVDDHVAAEGERESKRPKLHNIKS